MHVIAEVLLWWLLLTTGTPSSFGVSARYSRGVSAPVGLPASRVQQGKPSAAGCTGELVQVAITSASLLLLLLLHAMLSGSCRHCCWVALRCTNKKTCSTCHFTHNTAHKRLAGRSSDKAGRLVMTWMIIP